MEDTFDHSMQTNDNGLEKLIEGNDNGFDIDPQPNYLDFSNNFMTDKV